MVTTKHSPLNAHTATEMNGKTFINLNVAGPGLILVVYTLQ